MGALHRGHQVEGTRGPAWFPHREPRPSGSTARDSGHWRVEEALLGGARDLGAGKGSLGWRLSPGLCP